MFSTKYTYQYVELSVPKKTLSTNDHSLCLCAVCLAEKLIKMCKLRKGNKRLKRDGCIGKALDQTRIMKQQKE